MLSSDIAVDFGTSTIRIYLEGKGVVISEPSVMAVNTDTNEIVAIGKSAYQMIGRTAKNIVIERPFVGGIISNYSVAEYIVVTYIKRIGMGKFFLPNAVVSVPSSITEVEKHAISDVIERSGIRKINFIDAAVAAAMGAGLNVKASVGCMVVDVGDTTSTMAVISANQVLAQKRISIGGQHFNEAIIRYIRKKYNLEIGPITADNAKREIGSAFPREKIISCRVKGRDTMSGLPSEIIITSDEMVEALIDPAMQIAKSVEDCIEFIPPEILGDIVGSNVVLTGGGAKLFGLNKLISRCVRLSVILADNSENAIINGAGRAINLLDKAGNNLSFIGALSIKTK